jgi:hypothetical protein
MSNCAAIRSTGKAELFINEIFLGYLLHVLPKWCTFVPGKWLN